MERSFLLVTVTIIIYFSFSSLVIAMECYRDGDGKLYCKQEKPTTTMETCEQMKERLKYQYPNFDVEACKRQRSQQESAEDR